MHLPRPAALALAVALVALPAAADDPIPMSDATKEKVKRATAIVETKSGHGTGFLVRPNVLATNAHVIGTSPADALMARFVEDNGKVKAYPVKLLAIDGARDLALLWVTDDKFSRDPLDLRTDLKVGDKSVFGVLGNPGQWGDGWKVINSLTAATLSKELMENGNTPFYELVVPEAVERAAARRLEGDGTDLRARLPGDKIKTGPGNSGGPVLDATGRAVGVLTRALMEDGTPAGLFYAVPADDLKRMTDALGKPNTWDAACRQAALRHAHNVALLHLWAEVEVTAVTFDTRDGVWEIARNGNSLGYRLLHTPHTCDKMCIKAHTAACDSLYNSRRAVAVAAERAALGDESAEMKELRKGLQRLADRHANTFLTVRTAATAKDVVPKVFQANKKELDKYRTLIREEALKAGWDDTRAAQLTERVLFEAKMPTLPTR